MLFKSCFARASGALMLLAVVLLVFPWRAAVADTITAIPFSPVTGDSITLRVDGTSSVSPASATNPTISVNGSTIDVRACIPSLGFAVPSAYVVTYTVPDLQPGTYTAEYRRAACDGAGNVVTPFQLTATQTFTVVEAPARDPRTLAYIVAGSPPTVVRVIDTSTNLDAVPAIALPGTATGPVALSPNGRYLFALAANSVYQIDLRTRAIATVSLPATASAIALSPDGRRLYGAGEASLFTIDLVAGAVNSIAGQFGPPLIPQLAVGPDGTLYWLRTAAVYVCDLYALDPVTLNLKWTDPVRLGGTACTGITVSPDGRFVYASAPDDPHAPWAQIKVVSTATQAIVGSLDLGVNGLGPGPLALSPDGKVLYSLNGNPARYPQPGSAVTVIDTATLTVLKSVPIGDAASPGIALTPDGSFAYVTNGLAGTVSVLDTKQLGSPQVLPQFGTTISSGNFVGPPPTVTAIEYYNAGLDHYFVTSLDVEIAALDNGSLVGWVRTGQSFDVYPTGTVSGSPVCRFYIPPEFGDSHFYSASATECAEVAAKFPMLKLESPEVFRIDTPDASSGTCPPADVPVYRVWNQRKDSNHRYTTSVAIRDAMVAKGYVAEGYGPNGVALCAPH
jgi:DNA-binding beta-propeller fold protein YncE